MVVKEVGRFMRIWIQTLLPPAISMTLYFIIFGNLIGSRIGEMGGFSYMQYIAPGIIMMSIINNSYANVVSSFFGAKFQKHIEEMLVSPIPNYLILAGYITGGVTRGLLVGLIVSIVALFFTDLHVYSYTLMIGVVLLTSVLFSLGGMINGIFAKKFDDISIIPTFILTPFTYLGGVFYSIDLLPEFWQKVSLFNPILYMVNAFRYGMLGVSDINAFYALGIICIFVIGLSLFCLYLLNRGIGVKS
ncbi:MAG: ABC transporter permease [Gammaproteobacteria bacterium]|nr:ABC transporter permease [Gammaproteobacteria bacterium]